MSDHNIILAIRAMTAQRVNDSRDLDFSSVFPESDLEEMNSLWDNIYLPDYIDVAFLRNLSPFYMCGGGRNECLREIELICNAFNIRYKRIQNLIY